MEGVPGRSGLGRASMLNSTGFVFQENRPGARPCGAEPSRACVKDAAFSSEGSSKHLLLLDPRVPQVSYLSGPGL